MPVLKPMKLKKKFNKSNHKSQTLRTQESTNWKKIPLSNSKQMTGKIRTNLKIKKLSRTKKKRSKKKKRKPKKQLKSKPLKSPRKLIKSLKINQVKKQMLRRNLKSFLIKPQSKKLSKKTTK